ncbi:DNA mismatch repair protein MutS [Edaphobacter acidisoli]|uniref:DNA mismatch repair protein MutS n=1 Tax=Edaphobacter acidisoli TaxID=2040573 RepID=A0A916W3U8_9BACT|nr:mismatch repair protein [Edaphobacter acidisoli]GGA65191.1 DNA mismatch repair protein MutS [Edaphobacter acidisoli]
MPANPQPPAEEYSQRERRREATAAHFEQIHIRIGYLRLLLVATILVMAWWSIYRTLSPWWLLIPIAIFTAVAAFHRRVLHQRTLARRAADFYRRGIARIEDRWADHQTGAGNQSPRPNLTSHLYAADLDLFGPASLFQLLSQARTHMGEDTLASWLLAPSPIADIRRRQAAIAELRPRLDLREDLAILGDEKLKTGVHPEALLAWAEAPAILTHTWVRWLALVLAVAAIAAAIIWGEAGIKAPFFAVLIVEGTITLLLRKKTTTVLYTTEQAFDDLKLLSAVLSRFERETFTTPLLENLRQQLISQNQSASKAIARLANIVEYIHSLENIFVHLLDIPLLYTVQTAYAAESWRHAHGSAVRHWLNSIGTAEALLSLSAYSYEHPADPFPELIEHAPPSFHAEALGHPLLPAAKCVRNNINLGEETKALLVSGSNMSGKSTLLRAIGINTVLAMAGAPVRAASMKLTALQLGASILINDSLQQGSSRFYAEITRLRHISDLAGKDPALLFLLDELLQGTNSKDRLTGAQGIVRALLDRNAIGLISTHDLALTNIDDRESSENPEDRRIHNVHFQDEIENGKMKFDYKLREGIVTHSNGVELMRLIGLSV